MAVAHLRLYTIVTLQNLPSRPLRARPWVHHGSGGQRAGHLTSLMKERGSKY